MTSTYNGPRASIGLPVYNGDCDLGQALDFLLGQTFRNFELILCDQGAAKNSRPKLSSGEYISALRRHDVPRA